ncbi:MAG TPA: DoxX family protein [Gemmataceae bacterium]|nr:DoxX family protein [Gemmataceae bacterium]
MFTAFAKSALVPLLLRLALAAVFIFHGLNHVGGADHRWGADWNKEPGAPPAPVQLAVAWGELIGGIALACGFLTRLAAAGIAAIMAGAIATVHGPHGFDIQKGGFEYNFVIIVVCLALILGGPGPFAVDRVFRLKSKRAG